MPTRSDVTVVNSAYDTSGNGGRKLIQLKDGSLVAVVKNGTTELYVYRTTDGWTTKTTVYSTTGITALVDVSLVPMGNNIGILMTYGNAFVNLRIMNTSGGTVQNVTVDSGQSSMGNCSVVANETGTEIHAAWASKNATYPNSFNIRYAKGTINADGSVTWGTVVQRTIDNSAGTDNKNPSIVIRNGNPSIIYDFVAGTNFGIGSYNFDGSTWTYKNVYSTTTYTQSSPSAIFVTQSINGLANGLIGNVWHGRDATHTTTDYIRFSKSLDLGVNFSAMQKLVPGINGTLTANKSGKLFITYEDAGVTKRIESTDNGDTWSSAISVGTGTNPSSLFDLTMNMSVPLIIRKGTSSVLFNGTWTVTTISVTPGAIGNKTSADKANFLTYAITTDGTMTTITEKVNGVTIGTKSATSGQSLIAGLTQSQWDAIKYGKYKDATGGLNTITVEMGSDVWTYTFDKRLATNEDIAQAVKATQDTQTTYLPSVKTNLATAITSKGGTASGSDSWDTLVGAVNNIPGKKDAEGTATVTTNKITVTGLGFTPSKVVLSLKSPTSSAKNSWVMTIGDNVTIAGGNANSKGVWLYSNTSDAFFAGYASNVSLIAGGFSVDATNLSNGAIVGFVASE